MRVGQVYKGSPGDIAAARRLTEGLLDHLGDTGAPAPGDVVANVQLVVSELVTNAVKYAEGPCGVDLRVLGDAVEVCVWDTSEQPVAEMGPDPGRVGRHGLEIVRMVCGGFHVTTTATGKRVTARIPLRHP
ncbi:ATP-binding protein [Actinacidiphila paucisporea]|uniref:ATP-binding protein n=1 Tax=Actinacidiphila paucisporea TaxID=310782 RepID=UPI001F3984E8|nr:ATP-binding protein [Actinacidiphila paucisporea]